MNSSRIRVEERFQASDLGALRRAIHHGLHDGSSARLLHRLHALLLAAQCGSLREAAQVGGDSLRSLQRWQRRWREAGVDGLHEGEPHGRRARLAPAEWAALCERVTRRDREARDDGRAPMSAAALQRMLAVEFGQRYSTRQCRRFLGRMRAGTPVDVSVWPGPALRPGDGGWLM